MSYEKSSKNRYGENFQAISREARRRSPMCCWCLKSPSKETHHTRYVDDKGILLLDRAVIGIDLIPLCISCHKLVHKAQKYCTIIGDDKKNHNIESVVIRLQFGYLINTRGKKK